MSTSRRLQFYTSAKTKPLKFPVDVVLTFQPFKNDMLYASQYPVAWKIMHFNAHQNQNTTVTYTAELGVSVAQIDGNIISPSSDAPIALGQTRVYHESGWGNPTPENAPGSGTIAAVNNIQAVQTFCFGLYTDGEYRPIICEKNVTYQAEVAGEFHPMLYAYAVAGIKENTVFTAAIQHVLGSWNLSDLPASGVNKLHVYHDPNTTQLKIDLD